MKQRILYNLLLVFFFLAIFGAGYWFGQSRWAPIALGGPAAATPVDARESFTPFWEVWNLLHSRYLEQPLDNEVLVEGAIEGMLATLNDPNTRYLSPEHEQAARESMEGEIQGIGAEVESVDGNIVIVSPFEGSPAEAAGLQPGDILRQAGGVELTGMDVAAAAALVRGPAGTVVHLVVERDGTLFEVNITRDVIRIPSVRGEILDEGIAYVRLSRFANNTPDELRELLTDLLAQEPAGLILDLRRNPGGGLTAAVQVADEFLSRGLVLLERFGDGRERVFESSDRGIAQEIPMVVLIDEGSASASEVLAGALRDRERGILIGQSSFGKGTVQTWHSLSSGGGVRITVARWLTPDGHWVDQDGIEPHYVIPRPEEEPPDADTQLEAAVDYLLGRPILSLP